MQNFRMLSAIAAGAVLVASLSSAGAAFAQTTAFKGEAKLVTAASAPREANIGGVDWRCDGDACVGAASRKGNLDGLVRECRKVVAIIGPVASYKSGGRLADEGQLKACNRAATPQTVARN